MDCAPQSPGPSGLFLGVFLIPAPITLDGGLASYCLACAAWGTRHQAGRSLGKDQVLLLCCPGLGGHRFRVALVTWLDGIIGSRLPLPHGCSAPRQATGPLFLDLTLKVQTRGQSGRSLPPASRMPDRGGWHVDLHPPGRLPGCSQSWRPGKGVGANLQLWLSGFVVEPGVQVKLGVEFLKTAVVSLVCVVNDSPDTGW